MAVIGAKTREDHAKADSENTRVRFDNAIELASRNDFSNPDLKDRDDAGKPEGVRLRAPGNPQGWGVIVKRRGANEEASHQTAGPLPLDRERYYQDGPLIQGAPPQDASKRAKLAPPDRARVGKELRGNTGLKGGFRGIAHGWIISNGPRSEGGYNTSEFLTDPSPRIYVELEDGEGAEIGLPQEAPEGAVGVYIAATEHCSTENEAATAQLWIQRRYNITDGLRTTWNFFGAFRKEERAPDNNRTYIGGPQWGSPKWRIRRGNVKMRAFATRLSWQFSTEFGWSLPQEMTGVRNTTKHKDDNRVLSWHPNRFPKNARFWRPLFLGPGGIWYALKPLQFGRWAEIFSNVPEHFPEGAQPEAFERNRALTEPDATGIPAPDGPLEEARIVLRPALPPGTYEVRLVWYDEDGDETAPGPPEIQEIELGYDMVIRRPSIGNLIPNAKADEIDETGKPRGWEFPPLDLVIRETPKGVIRIKDNSDATTNEDGARTPWIETPPDMDEEPYRFRLIAKCTRYNSGRVKIGVTSRVSETDPSPAQNTELVYNVDGLGRREIRGSVAWSDKVGDIKIPRQHKEFRIRYILVGNSSAGTRDLDVDFYALGKLQSLVVPRTYPMMPDPDNPDEPDPDEDEQEDNAPFEYPRRGIARLVKNIPNRLRHPDLIGIDLYGFDYWAPYKTPAADEYGLRGYRTPIASGDRRTVSAYVSYEGVSRATNLMHVGVFSERGELLLDAGPIVPNVIGDNAGPTRYVLPAFTAPANAAYYEIYKGGFSDGYVRVMGVQADKGSLASNYTNRNAGFGYRTYTFDTGLAGAPAGSSLAFLGDVAQYLSAGAAFTEDEDEGTNVQITFSTSHDGVTGWSPYVEAWGSAPKRRFWRINIALSSTDLTKSPLVEFVGIEILRKRAMLLRADGSEYETPVQAVNFPEPTPRRKRVRMVSDDNSQRFAIRGRRIWDAQGIELETYSGESARGVGLDAGLGRGLHMVEDHWRDRRYLIWMEEEPTWSVDREIEPVNGDYWIYRASVDAIVLSQESLVGEAIFDD